MYINPYQPERPETGKFRTYISNPANSYNVTRLANIITQIKLYRWAKSLDYVNMVSIASLHAYLFHDQPDITKHFLGKTVLQAVTYDPRKMKAATRNNPTAAMCYLFDSPEDLYYGLEWMIVIWLRQMLGDTTKEEIGDELEFLAHCTEEELTNNFLDPLAQETFTKIDWYKLYEKHDLYEIENKSQTDRPALISFEGKKRVKKRQLKPH